MLFPITVPAIVAAKPAFHLSAEQEVVVVNDIAYYEGPDADAKKHKLDVYTPKGLKDFPVVFFIHGGTWSSGDRKMYGNMGQMFARQGIGVVVISYRLSPAVTHPAHIEDVARAFAWTAERRPDPRKGCRIGSGDRRELCSADVHPQRDSRGACRD